jgi:tRNA (guanine37-N1)-methyltransferase
LDYETFELDLLEFPQYTRPCVWRETSVPEILLSGDHGKIAEWQKKEAEKVTEARRPDLWAEYLGGNHGGLGKVVCRGNCSCSEKKRS